MAPQSESIRNALIQFEQNAPVSLRVHFPNIVVNEPGVRVSRALTSQAPTLSVSAKSLKLDASKKYIAICLDLDPPYPSMPIIGPLAHGVQGDLQLAPLEGSQEWLRLNAATDPVIYYAPPSPPPFSSAHRYLFLLWEQPQGLSGIDIRNRLGLPEAAGMSARIKWDQTAFEEKIGLKTVLGSTYFLCS